jgi:hypothetical protein
MKEKEDYYDDKFDATVRKEMDSAKFQAMSDEDKKKYLNEKRDKDFAKMKEIVQNDNLDLMSKKAMDFFEIPEEKRELVDQVIKNWASTRDKAENGIRDKMNQLLRQKQGEFENATDEEKLKMM